MNFKSRKHRIFFSFGLAATAVLPLATALACGEDGPSAEDLSKLEAAKKLFTAAITTQTVTESTDYALTPGPKSAHEIDALNGLTNHMPDTSETGATVTYSAEPIKATTQDITVHIEANNAKTTLIIKITYGSLGTMTDTAKLEAVMHYFTSTVTTQTVTTDFDDALVSGVADYEKVNAVLVNKLSLRIPYGVTVIYNAAAADAATLTQVINISVSALTGEPKTAQINLTYPGITLASFKAAHPQAISDDGKHIVSSAFISQALPAGFALPYTVTDINESAFQSATLPTGFKLPKSVNSIGTAAFRSATLPTSFSIPPLVTVLANEVFFGVHLPAGFSVPATVTEITYTAFTGAYIPQGFTLPSGIRLIDGAFERAYLPLGFTIPSDAVFLESTKQPFRHASLPAGAAWHDAQGNVISDQDNPTPGCAIKLTAP